MYFVWFKKKISSNDIAMRFNVAQHNVDKTKFYNDIEQTVT